MSSSITMSTTRSSLLSLQDTATHIQKAQGRISAAGRTSSALDNAVQYFQAKSLSDRAADLSGTGDGIDQGISTIKTAVQGLDEVGKMLAQIKGLLTSYKEAGEGEKGALLTQIQDLKGQVDRIVNDASYRGINLLQGKDKTTAENGQAAGGQSRTLVVQLSSTNGKAVLNVDGVASDAESLGLFKSPEGLQNLSEDAAKLLRSWTGNPSAPTTSTEEGSTSQAATATSEGGAVQSGETLIGEGEVIDGLIGLVDEAMTQVRSTATTFGSNVALLQTRKDFTKNYVDTLEQGAGRLSLADLNEDGANLLALQTRQQLGTMALSLANQSQQSVMRLFG